MGWSVHPNRSLKASVSGRPVPLVRHRTGRGFLYNPSAVPQGNLARAVEEGMGEEGGWKLVWEEGEGGKEGYEAKPVCFFGTEELLKVKAVFR